MTAADVWICFSFLLYEVDPPYLNVNVVKDDSYTERLNYAKMEGKIQKRKNTEVKKKKLN